MHTSPTPDVPPHELVGLAAIFSFLVPGLGHLLIGAWPRGAIWLAGWLVVPSAGGEGVHPVVVLAVQRERESVDLDAFRGLGRRHPWWPAALVVAFLSLLGLPPLAGFLGKLEPARPRGPSPPVPAPAGNRG